MVGTIVDVDLAVDAGEARGTDAPVGPHLVQALPSMLTRVSIALVNLSVTGGTAPPWRAVAYELGHLILTCAPVTGVVSALIFISLTSLAIPAWLAPTGVVIDQVCTLSIIQAWIRGTLIDIFLAQPPPVPRLALTSVPIYLIHTLSLVQTRVGVAFVDIHLTVLAIRPRLAMTLVSVPISELLTGAPILTRVYLALIDLSVTESTSVARVAPTCEVIDTINTDTIETMIASAVVDIPLASSSSKSLGAVTGEGAPIIVTDATIVARVGGAVINVDLTVGPSKPINTGAVVGIDTVSTDSIISTGVAGALVNISLAELSSVSWHADASELSSAINTGSFIHARVAVTLVNIHLAPRPSVSLWTSARVGSWSIDTLSLMFTRGGCSCTLVYILLACSACIPWWASAGPLACHWVGVTPCSRVAGVPQTLIFQVAE